jgi:hypothetical protein
VISHSSLPIRLLAFPLSSHPLSPDVLIRLQQVCHAVAIVRIEVQDADTPQSVPLHRVPRSCTFYIVYSIDCRENSTVNRMHIWYTWSGG